MMPRVFALAILAASLAAAAPNDWAKACFEGECSYELSSETGSGVFHLSGSPRSISDITPASGWVVLNCDPNALAQDIRLVCKSHEADAEGCSHLFSHSGPIDKIVRLPESCGAAPFARVVNTFVAHDQSIPNHMVGHIARRDGASPEVHVLTVDTNFAAVDTTKVGEVDFNIVAITIPGQGEHFNHSGLRKRAEAAWWDDAIKAVKTALKSGKDLIDKAIANLKENTKFEWKENKLMGTYSFDQTYSLIPKSLTQLKCPASEAYFTADITGKGKISAHAGVIIQGTFGVKVDKWAAVVGFSGDVDARLNLKAHASGSVSHEQLFIEYGIPPFNIPGVINLGPKVQLWGKVDAKLSIEVDADIGASFAVKDLEYWYPKEIGPPETKVEPKQAQTPLVLNAGVEVTGTAELSAHIIPKIVVGVDALKEFVKAGIFLELDIWGSAKASATASASVTAKNSKKGKRDNELAEYTPPYNHHARELVARGEFAGQALTPSAQAGFSGEVTVECGLDLVGGFEGKVDSLFNDKISHSFVSKKWTLYHKSFSGGKAKRSIESSLEQEFSRRDIQDFSKPDEKPKKNTAKKPGLQCPSKVVNFAKLVSEKVQAATWKGGVDYPSTHKSGADI